MSARLDSHFTAFSSIFGIQEIVAVHTQHELESVAWLSERGQQSNLKVL